MNTWYCVLSTFLGVLDLTGKDLWVSCYCAYGGTRCGLAQQASLACHSEAQQLSSGWCCATLLYLFAQRFGWQFVNVGVAAVRVNVESFGNQAVRDGVWSVQ